jgi:hypothetical protein
MKYLTIALLILLSTSGSIAEEKKEDPAIVFLRLKPDSTGAQCPKRSSHVYHTE